MVGREGCYRMNARVRRLNSLGFDVAEMAIRTEQDGRKLRFETQVVEPGHHQRCLFRLTGLRVQENEARALRADLARFRAKWAGGVGEGRARTVQVDEALGSIDFEDFVPEKIQPAGELLVRAPEFTVEKWCLTNPRRALARSAAALFVCLQGTVAFGETAMLAGDFFLVPAGGGAMELVPRAAQTEVLRVTPTLR